MFQKVTGFIYAGDIRVEMIHAYPEEFMPKEIKEGVNFLKYPHRHMLRLDVGVEVGNHLANGGRDIEFITLKRQVMEFIGSTYINSDGNKGGLIVQNKSVEMIAEDIANHVGKLYPGRKIIVKSFEDAENGVELIFHPEK